MTYEAALRYLESFINYERLNNYDYKKSFRLDRMKRLAAFLGEPQKDIPSIHIAGSKGKGSTAVIIHSILKNAGYRTGLYTSPHLVSFRERIRIDDKLISEEELRAIVERLKAVIERMTGEKPSFFEVYTALAFLYFCEKRVDFAVYETGLGGRLDATNIIEPIVSAITPLSYEHTDKLGSTLSEIAREKAGIIKANSVCVSAPQEEEAFSIIEEACAAKGSKLILVGRDILFNEVRTDRYGTMFNISGSYGEYNNLELGLLGSHQVVNAAVAIGIAGVLRSKGIEISQEAVRKGVISAKWEGRLETIGGRPCILLDGAQNRASAAVLAKAVNDIFSYKRLILILGVSKDKDIKGMLEELLPITDILILTKSKIIERAMEPSVIESLIDPLCEIDIELSTGVIDAIGKARLKAGPEDLILVTGSLFVVGEAREVLTEGCVSDRKTIR